MNVLEFVDPVLVILVNYHAPVYHEIQYFATNFLFFCREAEIT